MTIKESDNLLYRTPTEKIRQYLNFQKMRASQGLSTPADEEMVKKAQKHYSIRLLHMIATGQNSKTNEAKKSAKKKKVNEDAPTNAAGGGSIAGIGISSPTIKNPPQAEPGVREKKRILKRYGNFFKKA